MSTNLELWNKVEKTNPKYTKKAKISGHEITAIAPQYQIMQVTEQFGVYGEKWGFRNIELDYDLVDKFNLVVFKGTFFFPNGEFEIINSCKLYMDRALTMVDDNFAKKIETDALTKAISKLGFNADIFMGKFDDVRYVEEMKKEFQEQPSQEQQAENLRLNAIKKILLECESEDILKEQYLKLSANDKKTFAKIVAEIKEKFNK
jgi:hypothetical protein